MILTAFPPGKSNRVRSDSLTEHGEGGRVSDRVGLIHKLTEVVTLTPPCPPQTIGEGVLAPRYTGTGGTGFNQWVST